MSHTIKNKVILVTGGAGFIGSYVVEELLQRGPAKVIIIDNFIRGSKANMKNLPVIRRWSFTWVMYVTQHYWINA